MLIADTDTHSHKGVREMKLEVLGETSIAECIVYLDSAIVFIGSRFGDSQLIRLVTEPVDQSFVQVALAAFFDIIS